MKANKNKQGQTASEAYDMAARRVREYMKILEEKLDAHAKSQAAQPLNWGYAGDLGWIEMQLKNAIGEDAEAIFTERMNSKTE